MFDVEEILTHGGSLRIYAKHKEDTSKSISDKVGELLEENSIGISDLNYYNGFGEKVNRIKTDLLRFLAEQKEIIKK